MISRLINLISALLEIFRSLPDEQKKAITDSIAELFDEILRAFFKKSQDDGPSGETENA